MNTWDESWGLKKTGSIEAKNPDAIEVVRRKQRRGRQGVTVHDVARHAGVSSMTVSRVMNNHPKVTAAARDLVRASVEALQYVPNTAARNLASASMARIGFPYTNPRAAYNGELLIGVLDEASRIGSQLILERCFENNETAAVQRLVQSGIDGLIVPPSLAGNPAVLTILGEADLPWVTISGMDEVHSPLAVMIDDFAAGREVSKYLIDLGHCRIGFIQGVPERASPSDRYRGFLSALKDAGFQGGQVEQSQFTFDAGLAAAKRLLGVADRPTAILCANDDIAAGALSAAHELGLSVPGELSIVGFDDTPIASITWPKLTTVRMPIIDMAQAAVEMLSAAIVARKTGTAIEQETRRLFPHQLVSRASTAAKDHQAL